MFAGQLDREVTFLRRETTQDPTYGTALEGDWVPVATVWAQVQDMVPSRGERMVEGVSFAARPCRIRIRYREDISSDLRLTIDGRAGAHRIVTQPAELGRREGLELLAEQLTTEGQEP